MNENINYKKDQFGNYNTMVNGHKVRLQKNSNKLWSIQILKRNDIENGCTEFDTLWDDFKTLKDAKWEVELTDFNF